MDLYNIEVSVCCSVYNQVHYVEQMLSSIINQKTKFKFEVIVHDDASTDGTIEILKRYREKYPDIIELILEEENQYTKGVNILKTITYPHVKGKYMAFCEGDDFWIYDGKLQAQYELMESHPEISLCYHNALVYQEDIDKLELNIVNQSSGYIDDKDIICTTKGWYPTASVFYRSKYLASQPDLYISTGDETIRNYLACCGKLYFINQAWSVYRKFAKGSWNSKYEENKQLAKIYNKNMVDYYIRFNEYSDRRFEKYLYERMSRSLLYYIDTHCSKRYTMGEFRLYIEELKEITEHKADNLLEKLYSIEAIRCSDYYQITIEQKLKSYISLNHSLYIYGAGTEAFKAIVALLKYGMEVKGLIVSKKNSTNVLGYPLYEINEIDPDNDIIIWPCFVSGREEVIRLLQKKDYKNIII